MAEPTIIVVDMLISGWNPDNIDATFDETSRISTGWWDESNSHPQVTVTGVREDPSYTGIDPSGLGATSWVDGSVQVDVWVANDREATDGVHPRRLRYQLREEILRIVRSNDSGYLYADPDGEEHLLNRVEPIDVNSMVEDEESPVVFRYIIETAYTYYAK